MVTYGHDHTAYTNIKTQSFADPGELPEYAKDSRPDVALAKNRMGGHEVFSRGREGELESKNNQHEGKYVDEHGCKKDQKVKRRFGGLEDRGMRECRHVH